MSTRPGIVLALLLLAACGTDIITDVFPISVSVVPTTASLVTSGSQVFTARVANDPSNGGVTWSIPGCSGGPGLCGSLSNVTTSTATYTAPATVPSGALGITATAVADISKSLTVSVTIRTIPISVSVVPATASLVTRDSQVFTATVANDPRNGGVTWSITGCSGGPGVCGSMSNVTTTTGTYTAPATVPSGALGVTATAVADPTKAFTASVAVAATGARADIVFFRRDSIYAMYGMAADGTGVGRLTVVADHYWVYLAEPAWSPDGAKIAFYDKDIYVMNADGSARRNLTNSSAWERDPAWSPDGTRIAFESQHCQINGCDMSQIFVMNADGSGLTQLTHDPANGWDPQWSPDGTRILFGSRRNDNAEIYVMNADGSGEVNLTNNAAPDSPADWSPDGGKILFYSNRDGNQEIYVMNADGSAALNLSNNRAHSDYDPVWSPDGSRVAFWSYYGAGNGEIHVVNADGSGLRNITNHPAYDDRPKWSPDGMRIAFRSERDGNREIYVMNADGSGITRLTNNPALDIGLAWRPR